jgi:hypothetical protein
MDGYGFYPRLFQMNSKEDTQNKITFRPLSTVGIKIDR